MKVTKTSTQPAFQPIELKITIESQEELHDLLVFSSLSSKIREVLSNVCLDYDTAPEKAAAIATMAAVVVKAALALEDQADFDALVAVFKSMNALLEKSGLFQEQGVSAEAAEDNKESKLAQVIKSKYAKQ